MARQAIDISTVQPNGKRGEPAKGAFEKINNMTDEIYTSLSDLIPTASHIDMTPNRLLKTGDFGIGGEIPIFTGNIDNVSDVPIGFCYAVGSSTGTKPTTYGLLRTTRSTPSDAQEQEWGEITGGESVTLRKYYRSGYNSKWGPWRQMYHQGSVLGTVDMSGGVPTGAIIETGTNANGSYYKFIGGLLVCHGTFPNFTVVAGDIAVAPLITFPYGFIDGNYAISLSGTPNTSGDVYGFVYRNVKTTSQYSGVYRNGPASGQTIVTNTYEAVGRWF